jgi:hypothetical protein
MMAVVEHEPDEFLATHVYRAESLNEIFLNSSDAAPVPSLYEVIISSVTNCSTSLPSLYHFIVGAGFPVIF